MVGDFDAEEISGDTRLSDAMAAAIHLDTCIVTLAYIDMLLYMSASLYYITSIVTFTHGPLHGFETKRVRPARRKTRWFCIAREHLQST